MNLDVSQAHDALWDAAGRAATAAGTPWPPPAPHDGFARALLETFSGLLPDIISAVSSPELTSDGDPDPDLALALAAAVLEGQAAVLRSLMPLGR